jgi:hypothetical protein
MLGWSLRNATHTGHFQLGTGGFIHLLYGKIAGAEALRRCLPPEDETLFLLGDSLALAYGHPVPLYTFPVGPPRLETAQLAFSAKTLFWQYTADHPKAMLHLHVRAAWQLATGVGFHTAWHFTQSRQWAFVLASWQGFLVLGLGLGCLVWVLRGCPGGMVAWLLVGITASFLLLHLAVWSDGRYRYIADPFLLCLALPQLAHVLQHKRDTTTS